ncbi:MAG TPA: hypothetical protein VFK15_02680, partial [Burkholderiales bacterium]|nr:hypothetical protein [Burkholderiales bacterium]
MRALQIDEARQQQSRCGKRGELPPAVDAQRKDSPRAARQVRLDRLRRKPLDTRIVAMIGHEFPRRAQALFQAKHQIGADGDIEGIGPAPPAQHERERQASDDRDA